MKQIPLSRGRVALVDDGDFEWLSQWKWYAHEDKWNWYAQRGEGLFSKTIFMHRVIMNTPAGVETDHVDGNGLNNQRENLRLATTSQNQGNKKKSFTNASGYKGVYRHRGRWRARLRKDGVCVFEESFDAQEDAARAYDAKAREFFGEYARTNF